VDQETPRNLFGFKDGTNNIKAEDSADQLNKHLWVQKGDDAAAEWMTGGTYYVARRIRMLAEIWDRLRLIEQEQTMGRDKRYGAPLSITNPTKSSEEFTAVDYKAKDDKGETLVPADAHIAVVSPEQNQGRRMLRRGYNYTDGSDSLGQLQTGLFFIAFVRDPRTNFYPILDRMTKSDALQEYLKHEASALFAIPPGIKKGDTMLFAELEDFSGKIELTVFPRVFYAHVSDLETDTILVVEGHVDTTGEEPKLLADQIWRMSEYRSAFYLIPSADADRRTLWTQMQELFAAHPGHTPMAMRWSDSRSRAATSSARPRGFSYRMSITPVPTSMVLVVAAMALSSGMGEEYCGAK